MPLLVDVVPVMVPVGLYDDLVLLYGYGALLVLLVYGTPEMVPVDARIEAGRIVATSRVRETILDDCWMLLTDD